MNETLKIGTVDPASEEAKGRFIKGYTNPKSVDTEARTVEGLASTIELDRDGEIMLPRAFKAMMGKFLGGHAPFNSSHLHRLPDGGPPQIGWVMEVIVEAERVPCKFRFSKTKIAEQWWILASDPQGKGIGFSIGFIPIDWVYDTVGKLVKKYPELKAPLDRAKVADDYRLRVYTKIELLEISAVGVPSNRESVQLAAKLFGVAIGDEDGAEKIIEAVVAKVAERLPAGREAMTAEQVDKKIAEAVEAVWAETQAQYDEIIAMLPDPAGVGGPMDLLEKTGRSARGNPDDGAGGNGEGPDELELEKVRSAAAALRAAAKN